MSGVVPMKETEQRIVSKIMEDIPPFLIASHQHWTLRKLAILFKCNVLADITPTGGHRDYVIGDHSLTKLLEGVKLHSDFGVHDSGGQLLQWLASRHGLTLIPILRTIQGVVGA